MWTQIFTVLVLRFQKLSLIIFLNGADLFSRMADIQKFQSVKSCHLSRGPEVIKNMENLRHFFRA